MNLRKWLLRIGAAPDDGTTDGMPPRPLSDDELQAERARFASQFGLGSADLVFGAFDGPLPAEVVEAYQGVEAEGMPTAEDFVASRERGRRLVGDLRHIDGSNEYGSD